MLYDDGEQEQVFNDEWAASADMTVDELNAAEIDFLNAMVRRQAWPGHRLTGVVICGDSSLSDVTEMS